MMRPMVQIRIEYLSEPARGSLLCHVARIPVAGDWLYTADESLTAHAVMLAIDPAPTDPVAIVRVKY